MKEESGIYQVATLVDWGYPDILDKRWKKMQKLFKKRFNGLEFRKNRINTFVVTESKIGTVPSLDTRIRTEKETLAILKDYADEINAMHRLDLKDQTKIGNIYTTDFGNLGKLDLIENFEDQKLKKFNEIETKIERCAIDGSIIIWDMPGFEGDRVILPECVASFSDYPADSKYLVDMVDELLIANFAKRFLPFSLSLSKETLDSYLEFDKLLMTISEDEAFPDELHNSVKTFIGVISGTQESLKLFKREITKVEQVSTYAYEYLRRLPSSEIISWATHENPGLSDQICQNIDELMVSIGKIKDRMRLILEKNGTITDQKLNGILKSMITCDIISGGLLLWVHRFHQIPSFSSLESGIAYEELEGEVYEPKEKKALIEAQTLFKTFKRGDSYIYALRGVDITIKQGEFLVIQGPSGAGKTTLLNMLAGLDKPDRGGVFVLGSNIIELKDKIKSKMRRENFSFIFQSYALIPHLTAFENVKVPIDLAGLSEDLHEGIQKILDDVGIGQYSDHKPSYLSGGQMQRLGIARALINKPKILFADEPTGDLDEKTGLQVMDLLKKYHEETNTTIVLVTHDANVASYGTRKVFLMDGQIVNQLND